MAVTLAERLQQVTAWLGRLSLRGTKGEEPSQAVTDSKTTKISLPDPKVDIQGGPQYSVHGQLGTLLSFPAPAALSWNYNSN